MSPNPASPSLPERPGIPVPVRQLRSPSVEYPQQDWDEEAAILLGTLDVFREFRERFPVAGPVVPWDGLAPHNRRLLDYLAELLPQEYSQRWNRNYGPAR